MKSGVWNLGFGLVAVAAGASGKFTLPGTSSPTLLIVAGALVATLGVFQLWKNRGK
jgi:tetrahydromethanopterin S-methyltransferase subunit C